jgi:hypothetical protein
MKIFNIKDFNIEIEPEIISVSEFKVIWDEDKTKDKSKAYNIFRWIFYMGDAASPYSNYPEAQKLEYINLDCFKTKEFTPSKQVLKALDKYKELSETSIQRLYKAVKHKIDDISEYLTNTDIDEDTLPSVLKVIEQTSKLVAQMAHLEDAVNKEIHTSTKTRGNKDIGMYEL